MKRIDIYTIDVGGGHIAPAQALKQQFDRMGRKDLDVRVVNVGIVLRARFLRFIYKTYWNWALRYPPVVNAFYRGADNPFLIKIVDRIFGISILPRFVSYLEREKPDMVISTYFTFTHYLEMLKRVDRLDAITVMLNPEPFDSHQVWFSSSFDVSLVFSEKSRREIVAKGIPARTVKLFPFPIKPADDRRRKSKSVLRRELGLERDPFTVLFFFGAEGIGPVKKYAAAVAEQGLDMQVIVVCGKNQRLKSDMESFCKGNARIPAPGGNARIPAPGGRPCAARFVVKGFVSNLGDYIAAADVVVGKSGPNQVFETLVQERPIIISSFLANEKETTDWVIRSRAGWLTRTPDSLAHLLARLAARPQIIREYQKSIRSLGLRSGAPEICAYLAEVLDRKKAVRKRPMRDALRRLRDAVAAEGEAFSKRIDRAGERRRLLRRTRRARPEQPRTSTAARRRAGGRTSTGPAASSRARRP
jgi:UDP-N-acetylglucosamine:LPS N-acetylglucosamine transferase